MATVPCRNLLGSPPDFLPLYQSHVVALVFQRQVAQCKTCGVALVNALFASQEVCLTPFALSLPAPGVQLWIDCELPISVITCDLDDKAAAWQITLQFHAENYWGGLPLILPLPPTPTMSFTLWVPLIFALLSTFPGTWSSSSCTQFSCG